MTEIVAATEVVNAIIHKEILEFISERYTENDGVLTEATLALATITANLKAMLGLEFEVVVDMDKEEEPE